ncbi:hypothetical protein WCLP8_3140011 [uncultured Gammaproteobacteria bacterium]
MMTDPYISGVDGLHKRLVAARVNYYVLLDQQDEAVRQSISARMSFYVFVILLPLVIWIDNHFLPNEFHHYFVSIWLSLLPFLLIASLVYRRVEINQEEEINKAWIEKLEIKDALIEFVIGQIEAMAAAGEVNVFTHVYRSRYGGGGTYSLSLDQGFELYKAALGGEIWRLVHNRLVKDNRFGVISDDIHACIGNRPLAVDLLLHITALIVELNVKEGGGLAVEAEPVKPMAAVEDKEPAAQAA